MAKNLNLVQQIKVAEKKAKTEQPTTVVASTEPTVFFDVWWNSIAKSLSLQSHIKEIVWADFQSRGLKKAEPEAQYIAALRLFGYKI